VHLPIGPNTSNSLYLTVASKLRLTKPHDDGNASSKVLAAMSMARLWRDQGKQNERAVLGDAVFKIAGIEAFSEPGIDRSGRLRRTIYGKTFFTGRSGSSAVFYLFEFLLQIKVPAIKKPDKETVFKPKLR
jgi:hypothetical protein